MVGEKLATHTAKKRTKYPPFPINVAHHQHNGFVSLGSGLGYKDFRYFYNAQTKFEKSLMACLAFDIVWLFFRRQKISSACYLHINGCMCVYSVEWQQICFTCDKIVMQTEQSVCTLNETRRKWWNPYECDREFIRNILRIANFNQASKCKHKLSPKLCATLANTKQTAENSHSITVLRLTFSAIELATHTLSLPRF